MCIEPETCYVLCRTCSGVESEYFCSPWASDVSDKSLTANPFLDTWVSAGTARFYVTDDNKAVKWRNGDLVCQNPSQPVKYCLHSDKPEHFLPLLLTLYEPNSSATIQQKKVDWTDCLWKNKYFCAHWQKLRKNEWYLYFWSRPL